MRSAIALGFVVFSFVAFPLLSQAQTSLSIGSRGESVIQLQSFLATDRNIYPEGLITGYFGPLTKAAVMRLQRANELPVVGVVGPLTRALIASKNIQASKNTPSTLVGGKVVCNTDLIKSDGLDSHRVISKEACELVNSLYAQGKAAGNTGDTYENRDGLHVNFCDGWTPNPECPLANRLFPQHTWKLSGGAGRATSVNPGVTVGQASYAGITEAGAKHSIPYVFYKTQQGAENLYAQYTHNNIYIYPSLVDDSSATSPNVANTPYVINSKQFYKVGTDTYRIHDASGSDLPFVKIIMLGLASLKPEVKTVLVRSQHLIPTLQMLIRESDIDGGPHTSSYIAHRLVDGLPQPAYDSAKLVRLANELTLADIPPLAKLSISSETFTDDEKYFTTPGAIARHMTYGSSRTITTSAAGSIDTDGNMTGHTYEWRILSGSTSQVQIIPDSSNPATASIRFTAGTITERLDVGVFVKKNGARYASVPGIISVHIHP